MFVNIKENRQQPIDNATLFDVYVDDKKIAVRIISADGYELVKEDEEPSNIRSVDIPAMYEERINSYKSILWVEKPEIEEPEIEVEEPETETEATEEDYINALKELGVNFNG